MSSLSDAVNDAYRRAEETLAPADWALFHALNAALQAVRAKQHEPADTTGIPTAAEAGYVPNILVPLEEPNPNAPHSPGTPGWWMEG